MEKLNIAEMLKDCPSGMELDCNMYDNVSFVKVTNMVDYPIVIKTKSGFSTKLTKYGQNLNIDDAKCVIFPKGRTTWEGFQRPFKDGDIVTWEDRGSLVACIYKERKNTTTFNHHIALYKGGLGIVVNGEIALTDDELCFASEEEKQKLFDAIKANGYRWNPETKTLKKLIEPKFKVGDRIKEKKAYISGIITDISDDSYKVEYEGVGVAYVVIEFQDGWELVPNKFDITTLKPFDNCKYSLDVGKTWKFAQYWYIHDKYDVNEIEIDLWLN